MDDFFTEQVQVRILVTGGAGFIGSNLARRLATQGNQIVVVDDFSSAHWTNLIDFNADVVTHNVAKGLGPLADQKPFDAIYHQASITDTTVHDQNLMMSNNVEGFRTVLELARTGKSKLVWASSASIYGRRQPPNDPTQSPDPLNVYACSKMIMERLAEQYQPSLAHPIVALRYFNVYGPGEDHKGKFASMIHQLAKQMRAGKRPRVFTPGDQRRDFVYIDDVLQANIKALNASKPGVYNVGSGGSFSFNQVITELNRVLGLDLKADYFPNPYTFTQDWTQANIEASQAGIGYVPEFDLAKGIDAYHASGKLGMSV